MKKLKLLTVVFMLCLQGMIACRSDDISPQLFSSPKRDIWENPRATDDMEAQGIFAFLNGQKAVMFFDKNGAIISLNMDGDDNVSYEYDKTNGHLEITKWENIVAIPQNENQFEDYPYSKKVGIRWSAYLNGNWSGVQYLNSPEQANMEGIGTFELTYIPIAKPVIDPIISIRKDYSD